MLPSLLLAAFVFALALLCAWAVVHFGRKAGQSPGKLRALAIAFVLGGVLFSAFAYWVDTGQRRLPSSKSPPAGHRGIRGSRHARGELRGRARRRRTPTDPPAEAGLRAKRRTPRLGHRPSPPGRRRKARRRACLVRHPSRDVQWAALDTHPLGGPYVALRPAARGNGDARSGPGDRGSTPLRSRRGPREARRRTSAGVLTLERVPPSGSPDAAAYSRSRTRRSTAAPRLRPMNVWRRRGTTAFAARPDSGGSPSERAQ